MRPSRPLRLASSGLVGLSFRMGIGLCWGWAGGEHTFSAPAPGSFDGRAGGDSHPGSGLMPIVHQVTIGWDVIQGEKGVMRGAARWAARAARSERTQKRNGFQIERGREPACAAALPTRRGRGGTDQGNGLKREVRVSRGAGDLSCRQNLPAQNRLVVRRPDFRAFTGFIGCLMNDFVWVECTFRLTGL